MANTNAQDAHISTDETGRPIYWAASPVSEIADHILDKKDQYYEALTSSGRLDLYIRSWTMYNEPALTGASLNPAGQQGELTTICINNQRNLLLHIESITSQQRVAFQPMATNSDKKSQSQVILATGIMDYYLMHKGLENTIQYALKESLIYAESFGRVEWDSNMGEQYGINPMGAPQYQGDIKYSNYNPLSCIRDVAKQRPGLDKWWIVRDLENKYDLAAKFPELKDRILDDADDALEMVRSTMIQFLRLEDSDLVAVYTLLHERTPALPQGRLTMILQNRTVLLDGPLPYRSANIHRLAPDEMTGTIFGYTVGFDLMPINEAFNVVNSAAVSNNANFANQNVLVPKGHDTSVTQLVGGLNLVEYDPKVGKPEPLNLLMTPPETYNYMGLLNEFGQTISGINSVARGNPDASLKSGAALAMVQAQAIQFSAPLQRSFTKFCEGMGNSTIELTQDFATTPRIAEIAGKSNQPILKDYIGSDISEIKRVSVETTSPAFRTVAGKTNMAELYLDKGLVQNQDQFVQTVNTGRFEPIVQGRTMALLNIKGENEKLAMGLAVRAFVTDQHLQHIEEHTINLSSPEARENPNDPGLLATMAHIQEHKNFLMSPVPDVIDMLRITGQQSFYVPPMMGMMPGQQPMPGPGGPPPGGAPGVGPSMDATHPTLDTASGVNMPSMPNAPANADPATKQIIEDQQIALA